MKKLAFLVIICFVGLHSFSQNNNPIVMKLGEEDIRFSEFENTFSRNNDLSSVSDEELRSFVDLYALFRLKYAEAIAMRLDTISALQEELDNYRSQAVIPYLTDKEVSERIFNEVVERMKWDIRASHILKQVPISALPADTLAAYNAILKLRTRIINGEAFGDVAVKESDDPSAKDRKSAGGEIIQQGNRGDLGYFTTFDMIYSFESGAYNTAVGTISMPVRSEFGYHLIFVHDKRPAMGKYKAMQILIPFNKSLNLTPSEKTQDAEQVSKKVHAIYNEIKNGLAFEDAFRKYAEEGTNGKLPIFGCNRFEGNFIKELYGLKKDEISKPIQSSYGYHIVKIEDHIPVQVGEDAHSAIRTRILQDTRSFKSRESFIERVKKENGFKEIEDKKAKTLPIQDFYTALDSNIFNGTYNKSMVKQLVRPLFVHAQKTYTQQDFAQYLEDHQFVNIKDVEMPVLVNFAYKHFIDNTVMDYENSQVEIKHPKFANEIREYRTGVLIYELNERKVWKGDFDSVDLQNYYESVKHSHLYPVRVKAEYIKSGNAAATQKAEALLKKGTPIQTIMGTINKKNVALVLDTVTYWQGQNKQFDKNINWEQLAAGSIFVNSSENELVRILEVLPPSPKPYEMVKNVIGAEYQLKMDEEWVKELKKKILWVDYETIISLCKKK